MGKMKKKEQKFSRKYLSTDRSSSTSINGNSATNEILREQKITPVIKGTIATSANDRSQYLATVENLVTDAACRKLLLKDRIVPIIMEHALKDSTPEVVVRGWGVLRSLAQEEGYDVSIHLYRKDIMTPIKATIENVGERAVSWLTQYFANVL